MEYERENYEYNCENYYQSIFDNNENHKFEDDFLEDVKEKEQIYMNPSFNSTYNSSYNNIPNMPSNISLTNISSNESSNNFSNNESNNESNDEYVECIQNVSIINKNEKKKEKEIKKNTNQGRKTKNEAMNCETNRNKFAKDNIFRKLKTNFFNKFIPDYLNIKIDCVYQKQKYLVRKFNKALVTDVSIQFNIDLFNSKIRDLLNQEISNKYSTVNLDTNKAILRSLEKNPEFNDFLNKSVNEIYSLFINDNYKEIISSDFNIDKEKIDFENLAGTIDDLKEQGYEEKYIEKFKEYAQNINSLMDATKKRKQRNKNKIKVINNN
jgi:hypothetical protein